MESDIGGVAGTAGLGFATPCRRRCVRMVAQTLDPLALGEHLKSGHT
jgi:hypothetical protein